MYRAEDCPAGIDGSLSFTAASATAAASCRIFSDSSLVASESIPKSPLWNVSVIRPFNISVMEPSS